MSSPWTSLGYDALDRLASIDSTNDTNFAYDGLDMIAEYDPSGTMQARYVHGPGMDQPLVRYDGSGINNKVSLHSDERGSITAWSYGAPYVPTINKYDEFGKPQPTNVGRFQYTGQMWLPEAGLYHYKARAYAPHLGRFLQTDPIGYADSPNLYAYVLNDPINLTDPLGLQTQPPPAPEDEEIVVIGTLPLPDPAPNTVRSLPLMFASDGSTDPLAGIRTKPQCPAVPEPGAGKGVLDKNIKDAILDRKVNSMDPFSGDLFGLNFSNVTNFVAKVRPGGSQDYKNIITGAAEFGNFNYGAVGGAYGFSLGTLLDRAANVQTGTDLFSGRGLRLSDNPDDPRPISSGHQYFSLGCFE